MVELRNIHKSFGDVQVLNGYSLCSENGFVFHLSSGEKRLLAFEKVLVHSPKLALLDEPFAEIDVKNSEVSFRCIDEFRKKDTTFIVVAFKLKKTLEVII